MDLKNLLVVVVLVLCQLYISSGVSAAGLTEAEIYEPDRVGGAVEVALEGDGLETLDDAYAFEVSLFHRGILEAEETFHLHEETSTFYFRHQIDSAGSYVLFLEFTDQDGDIVDSHRNVFDVSGGIGPLDLEMEPVSHKVEPNGRIPFRYSLKNLGTDDIGVLLEAQIFCDGFSHTFEDEVRASSTETLDGFFVLDACDAEGNKDVRLSASFAGEVLSEVSTGIELENTPSRPIIKLPETVEIPVGGSETLDVKVRNEGEGNMNDIYLVMPAIDQSFYRSDPDTIGRIGPGDTALFFLDISSRDRSEFDDEIELFLNTEDSIYSESFSLILDSDDGFIEDDLYSSDGHLEMIFKITIPLALLIFVLVLLRAKKKNDMEESPTVDDIIKYPDRFLEKEVMFDVKVKPLKRERKGNHYYRVIDETNDMLGVSRKEGIDGKGKIIGTVKKKDDRLYIKF